MYNERKIKVLLIDEEHALQLTSHRVNQTRPN